MSGVFWWILSELWSISGSLINIIWTVIDVRFSDQYKLRAVINVRFSDQYKMNGDKCQVFRSISTKRWSMSGSLNNIKWTLHSLIHIKWTLISVKCSLINIKWTLISVRCTQINVKCTLINIKCKMINVKCTLINANDQYQVYFDQC